MSSDEGGLWDLMDRQEALLRRSPFRIRDSDLQTYLRDLTCNLAGSHCPDVRVYPLRNATFNANMAPNGMMQIYSGLMLRMENEAQLATVLAHELGHYMQRHALAQLRDAKSRSAFSMFMGAFGVVGLLPQLAALAGAFSFSREQEREADAVGLQLMEDAGYDPAAAATVWSNLLAEVAATAGNDPQSSSPWFATHPPSSERFEALRDLAGDRRGLLNDEQYQARLRPLRIEWLDDELRRGRPAETLFLLDRMLLREPNDAVLLYFRGESRHRRAGEGDAALAIADLQAAIASGGAPAQTHRALGQLQLQLGDRAAARESFERYLALSPQAADAPMVRKQIEEMQP